MIMDEHDLAAASREMLLAILAEHQVTITRYESVLGEQTSQLAQRDATISELQKVIAELQKRITALEQRLAGRGGPGMPGNKPPSPQPSPAPKARQKRGQGFGRRRLAPTEAVSHAVETCPDCGTRLQGGWVQRRREVIELPILPVRVIEHQYLARECPLCRRRLVPPVALEGLVLGERCRLGLGMVSLITTLREEGRLPFATIQWYLATVHHLHLSVGELVSVVGQVARRATDTVEAIVGKVRQSRVVHADETGWREHGVNGYVWTFSTPTERYFLRRGRNKEVVDEVLGTDFAGVLVSDFYAGYHHYLGVHQRCWAHLLREMHDLQQIYPADISLADWAAAVLELYQEAVSFTSADERVRLAKQGNLEGRLLACCQSWVENPLAVQAKLCRRIVRHINELLVFVGHPAVPATNNAAERSLRHLVTSRKISGGTQSKQGTTSKMTLASLFGTWRARGLNPLQQCLLLLQSPHQ